MTAIKQLILALKNYVYLLLVNYFNTNEPSKFIKVVVITKESGKRTFTKWADWQKFIMNETLHSTTEPAYQEYYKMDCTFVWYYNGKKHRPDAPASYKYRYNKFNKIYGKDIHKFKFEDCELYHYQEDVAIVNTKVELINPELYLDGVFYWNSDGDIKKFLRDSKKYSRECKINELFKDE